jgi:hypothetical protein
MNEAERKKYDNERYQRIRQTRLAQVADYYQKNRKRLAAKARRNYWKKKLQATTEAVQS